MLLHDVCQPIAKEVSFFPKSIALILCICFGGDLYSQQPWNQFRGPTGMGISFADLPTDLSDKANHVWTFDTQGVGWSSPVVANGQVWFTTAITKAATPEELKAKLAKLAEPDIKTFAASVELRAVCLDVANGKLIHDIELAKVDEPDPINPLNSFASPTPAIAGDQIICHFGNYGTWCLDGKSGKSIWMQKLVVDHSVGPGSSPVVFRDKVILVCDGTDKQFVAALNLADGSVAWKTDRPPLRATNGEFKKAYCTPLLIPSSDTKVAVIPGAQWTVAYNPVNGKELWRVDCGEGFSTTPMPVFVSGLIVMSTGYMRPEFVAIRPNGSGDVSQTHTAWRSNRGAPTMPSPIAHNGLIYAISDNGILTLMYANTGEEINRLRVGGNFSASPIMSRDNVYLCSREGIVTVVRQNEALDVISTNEFGNSIMASPAVVGNDLILRTEKQLIRITSTK